MGLSQWFYNKYLLKIILLFHILVWKTVTPETLVLNSALIPAVIVGFFLGAYIVRLISNVNYRRFILIVTAIGGFIMLFK